MLSYKYENRFCCKPPAREPCMGGWVFAFPSVSDDWLNNDWEPIYQSARWCGASLRGIDYQDLRWQVGSRARNISTAMPMDEAPVLHTEIKLANPASPQWFVLTSIPGLRRLRETTNTVATLPSKDIQRTDCINLNFTLNWRN